MNFASNRNFAIHVTDLDNARTFYQKTLGFTLVGDSNEKLVFETEDALAGDLSDMFTTALNPAPYAVLPEDPRVFDPALARTAKPRTSRERADLADVEDGMKIRREFSTKKAGKPGSMDPDRHPADPR